MITIENERQKLPIFSWVTQVDELTLAQAKNLASHPSLRLRVCLMPDAHVGYGMPIGGVIACESAVIPNAVGVDIGCGMSAVKTDLSSKAFDKPLLRQITVRIKQNIPVGEGNARREKMPWEGFEKMQARLEKEGYPDCFSPKSQNLDERNLGTLGGGNHFIEIQESEEGKVWIMLHSGSRNLGNRVAAHYFKKAIELNAKMGIELPHKDIAFLPTDDELGANYIRDMQYALEYAYQNRRIMMDSVKALMSEIFPNIKFESETNIHHNYAALEEHEGSKFWVHRKGATRAYKGEIGIIPGSMGTSSYIVEGLGNPKSFMSCSHGAGRRLGRSQANATLTREECDAAMDGIIYDYWKKSKNKNWKSVKDKDGKKLLDLSEAPQAYKNIDEVIAAESDLIKPIVKLRPLAVVKG